MHKSQPTIVMVGGGLQQVTAVKYLQLLGYRVLVVDKNDQAKCRSVSNFFFNSDGQDHKSISDFIIKKKRELNILGIFTLTELVETVSRVGLATGLPCVSVKAATLCQNKELSKNIWLKNGISTPVGGSFKNKDSIRNFFDNIGRRAFAKPIKGFGGIGACELYNFEDLERYISSYPDLSFVLEEVCRGDMIDVNAYFDKYGKFVPLGCFDREFDKEVLIEKSGTFPSKLPSRIQSEALELTKKAALSLGINWGPVKADLVSTKEGLKILEMAPRLHGPKGTLFLTKMAKGTEHLSHIAPLLIGQDVDEEKFIKPQQYASFKLIVSPNIPFKVIHGAKEIREDGCEIMLFKKSSSRVIRYRNSSDAIGYVFAACEKYSDLEDKLNGALKKIYFE